MDEERTAAFLRLSARSKWILSGTPALRDFADVKSIARHLGVHLGIDDDADVPSQNARLKAKKSHLTSVEKFLAYQVPHSNEWYQNRHRHAQRFLNNFPARTSPSSKVFQSSTMRPTGKDANLF